MVLYIEYHKEFTKNRINRLSKIGEYKINIKKSLGTPHTSNEQFKNKIEKTISLTTASHTQKNNNTYNQSN